MSPRRSAEFRARIAANRAARITNSGEAVTGEIHTAPDEADALTEEYDTLNAKSIIFALEEGVLDSVWVEDYEEANKGRKTILNWIAEHG